MSARQLAHGMSASGRSFMRGVLPRHGSSYVRMSLFQAHGAGISSAPAVCAWRREHFAKARVHTQTGKSVEMENFFSRLTLDIIGKAVFNYDFDSLTHDDPVIQVGPACS